MGGEALPASSLTNLEMPGPVSTDRWENEGGSFSSSSSGETRGVLDATVARVRPFERSPRSYLLPALERVLNGAELSRGELEASNINSKDLTRLENDAWEQLGHWVDEAEVRVRDRNYTAFHLEWLRDLHAKLAQ
jgi:hypothetical protein